MVVSDEISFWNGLFLGHSFIFRGVKRIYYYIYIYIYTCGCLPETNITPENSPSEKESSLPNHHFSGTRNCVSFSMEMVNYSSVPQRKFWSSGRHASRNVAETIRCGFLIAKNLVSTQWLPLSISEAVQWKWVKWCFLRYCVEGYRKRGRYPRD